MALPSSYPPTLALSYFPPNNTHTLLAVSMSYVSSLTLFGTSSSRLLLQQRHRLALAPHQACCFFARPSPSPKAALTRKMEPTEASGCCTSGGAAPASASTETKRGPCISQRRLNFGRTYVREARGKHIATIVWLHGLGDTGESWAQILETVPLDNVKWIVPTAPIQPVSVLGGFPCPAWFDVGLLSEDLPDDFEGLDSSAAHVAQLLSNEPSDIKLGIGGFSQGAATALYTMTCSVAGKYSNGSNFPFKLSAAVAISGWLPCAKLLKSRLGGDVEALKQADKLPLFFGHGTADDIVLYKYGEMSVATLQSSGFRSIIFKTYHGLGHSTSSEEMNEICAFLRDNLGLEDSSS